MTLTDTYVYRGTGGRRYPESAPLDTEEEQLWERRTATLTGGHKDLRPVCCGEFVHDGDCENGDYRLIASRAAADGFAHLVPSVFDFIEHRPEYINEICELRHGCDKDAAKRVGNVVGNGGRYYTWLRNYGLETPGGGLKAFHGKRCKTFLPVDKCGADEPNMERELRQLREAYFVHPRYREHVDVKRRELEVRDGQKLPKHATSLWSNLVQTWEDEVLGIIDETLFGLGWDTWYLAYDGLAAAPSPDRCCDELNFEAALQTAQVACRSKGWEYVQLTEKPLHGKHEEMPKTIIKAREAIEKWNAHEA